MLFRSNSADAAVRITYGAVFAAAFLPLAPYALTRGTAGFAATVAEWLRRLSPVPVVMHLVGQAGAAGGYLGLTEAIRQITRRPLGPQVPNVSTALVAGFGMINYDRGLCSAAAVLERA